MTIDLLQAKILKTFTHFLCLGAYKGTLIFAQKNPGMELVPRRLDHFSEGSLGLPKRMPQPSVMKVVTGHNQA